MSATADDTIVALASGPGRAAIAVIRLAGPRVAEALRRMCGALPHPRVAALIAIRHPVSGNELDRGLVLWFPGPRSFTGDDAAELHVHGGRAVVDAVLGGVLAVPGCRLAEPGEFTRRAFLNGKLDLAAVEGLADLIEAETDAQRRQALSQLDGVLGRWVGDVRDRLLEALALTESAIDFADEGDIATSVLADARRMARQLAETIDAELARPLRGERIRDGFVVTLAGAPNAGKSTLLNALARREVAIVSPHAGTTRDPIEVDLDLGGYAVRLIDTAGLRDTLDPVEQEGVARARARAAAADLVLWLDDVSQNDGSAIDPSYRQTWRLGTKADRVAVTPDGYDLVVSAHTGSGLDTLIARLERTVAGHLGGGETALVTRIRHRQALQDATATLARAGLADEAELAAEELRSAARALGRITGEIAVEEILGAIFSRFCIGK